MSELGKAIEHTLLKAEATKRAVEKLCAEALEFRFRGVCVNPIHVPLCGRLLAGSEVLVVTVVGFPLGASLPDSLEQEARIVTEAGAHEVDMVIPIGRALDGDLDAVRDAVKAVCLGANGRPVKAIIETGHFQAAQLRELAVLVCEAGASYLKTSTGFGPRGASVDDIRLFADVAPPGVGIKASGGVKTSAQAIALLAAGATRIGTSSGVALVTGSGAVGGY